MMHCTFIVHSINGSINNFKRNAFNLKHIKIAMQLSSYKCSNKGCHTITTKKQLQSIITYRNWFKHYEKCNICNLDWIINFMYKKRFSSWQKSQIQQLFLLLHKIRLCESVYQIIHQSIILVICGNTFDSIDFNRTKDVAVSSVHHPINHLLLLHKSFTV